MFVTTFPIDLLNQIVIIITTTYLKIWNFVIFCENYDPDLRLFYAVTWIFHIISYKLHRGMEHTKRFILVYYEPGKGNKKWIK